MNRPGGTTADLIRRGLVGSTIEGCLFALWMTPVAGNYLTGAALYLGAGGLALGFLGALPHVSTMLQSVAAPFVLGLQQRRRFLAIFAGLQRFGAALAGLVALWLYPSPAALILFVSLHVISWAFMAPCVVVWQGYMTDLVPLSMRGMYFARRNAWIQFVAVSAVLAYGAVLDRWPGATGFRALYLAALAAAVLNTASWFLLPELPPGEVRSARPFWESIRIPLTRPGPHRDAIRFFALWACAQGMSVPFYPVALMQKQGLSFSNISLLSTVGAVTAISTSVFWGRLQERIGQARVIGLLTAIMSAVPLLFLGARWGGWPFLLVAHMLQGSALNAMQLASLTLNMRLSPSEDRATYLALFAAAGGATGFLTPVLAGPLTSRYLDQLFIASGVASAALSLLWNARFSRTFRANPGM